MIGLPDDIRPNVPQLLSHYGLSEISIHGNELTCVCPFHDGNGPHLSVNINTGLFQCFSCRATGNLVSLVRKLERCSRHQALKYVLEYSDDVDLKSMADELKKKLKPKKERHFDYRSYLIEPEPAYDYLEHVRHINRNILYAARVGYDHEDQSVVFPIFHRDFCVSFVKRRVDEKFYRFTLGTKIKRHLYEVNYYSRSTYRDVVIVEGTVDCLKVQEAIVRAHLPMAVVAVFGNVLGREQFQRLQERFTVLHLMFDNDDAGMIGRNKATDMIRDLEAPVTIKYVDLPVEKKDPGKMSTEEIVYALTNSTNYLKQRMLSGV
jgi:DNA primase